MLTPPQCLLFFLVLSGCARTGPSSLVRLSSQDPGEACPAGGVAIAAGLDDDGSGTLEDGEIDSFQVVCHGEPGAPAPAEDSEAAAAERVEELTELAVAAAKDTEFRSSLQLCQRALELSPKHQRANQTCAIAACNLTEAELARTFLAAVDSHSRRSGLEQICIRRGVSLTP